MKSHDRIAKLDNPLLELWRQLSHDPWSGDPLEAANTLTRWGIPFTVPEAVLVRQSFMGLPEAVAREYAVSHWAWAVPDEYAIDTLVGHSPLLEIGAGTGYWARLASQAGADIIAVDTEPPVAGKLGKVKWARSTGTFFPVRRGDFSVVSDYPDRTLFLCWPHGRDMLASRALSAYQGTTVVFVGELNGCTGDAEFFEALNREWTNILRHEIPRWVGLHDRLYIFQRKERIPDAPQRGISSP
jgi:hypothetical protein